jgi:D-glycero-alpha-D-manno-heptose-7-phosphate kinase
MIITRSPLRISIAGGGTDLASYYRRHGGFLIAAAIDKYVYITLHSTFAREIIVKYSKMERVADCDQVQHPIVREVLKLVGITEPCIEITSMADIPAGTGLGSSSSFTTALLKAMHTYCKNLIPPHELAEQACDIEINRLGEPIGKQDQYIAAYGGITCFYFQQNDSVCACPLRLSAETLRDLEENLILFFTGYLRSASSILQDQNEKSLNGDEEVITNLHFVKQLGFATQKALQDGKPREFALLMKEHWEYKKLRSRKTSNSDIDAWHSLALANGALSGKLIGAGGGGFLLFYSEDKARLRQAMTRAGLREVRFHFEFEGTKVVAQ